MIDLHAHTTASDGSDTPTELVGNAVAAGLHTLAITDHDTTGGWQEAGAAVGRLDVPFTLIRGTEFSCIYDDGDERISLHLLGYLFDPEAESLKAERARLRESRLGRGEAIVDALVAAGYPISWQQVIDIAGGGAVGRPHIGQALVQAGVVDSVTDAFAHLLSSSSPYYVPKLEMPVELAIELIRQAGGVPVIAHPWARRRGRVLDEAALRSLVEPGLLGIEVDHLDHAPDDRARLTELAEELGLLSTGSSDYHGTRKKVGLGSDTTSPESLERLLGLATGIDLIHSPATG
ncbi:PHP domain-containing protein [Jatrophihabitans sp.]|uniref:PHP domain-containing protein n=1 Tax=Jatrophihabitans sp. TaxID=1932789 RepID=UPI002C70C56C|nr:PHP domain-containing protein [Jatrophihabitans sp.]